YLHVTRLCRFSTSSTTYAFEIFFFKETPTSQIYTLSLHDALPILKRKDVSLMPLARFAAGEGPIRKSRAVQAIRWLEQPGFYGRSEEHTSELQSRGHLVCRLLLEKKKW